MSPSAEPVARDRRRCRVAVGIRCVRGQKRHNSRMQNRDRQHSRPEYGCAVGAAMSTSVGRHAGYRSSLGRSPRQWGRCRVVAGDRPTR